jgi:hypothetical protein
MSEGFSEEKIEVSVNKNEVKNLLKRYKKIKKYMRSPVFTIKTLDGTEKVVSELLRDSENG